jgi:hypothetical protein
MKKVLGLRNIELVSSYVLWGWEKFAYRSHDLSRNTGYAGIQAE